MAELVTTTFRISSDLLKEVKIFAAKNNISMGKFFRQAIKEKLDLHLSASEKEKMNANNNADRI